MKWNTGYPPKGCMGLANRPRCPITGRLNICPLKESEKE